MVSRLLLVRHGETDLTGTFCGQSDPDLNARGQEQARELAQELKSVAIDAVYSSDLLRARRTAESLAHAAKVTLQVVPALREIAFGAWEALRWPEIETRFPQESRLWMNGYPRRSAPGGESIQNFEHRVRSAAEEILGAAQGTVCIVSHGGVMRLLLKHLSQIGDDDAWALTREHAWPIFIDAAKMPTGVFQSGSGRME